jgi:hypothetical protein
MWQMATATSLYDTMEQLRHPLKYVPLILVEATACICTPSLPLKLVVDKGGGIAASFPLSLVEKTMATLCSAYAAKFSGNFN